MRKNRKKRKEFEKLMDKIDAIEITDWELTDRTNKFVLKRTVPYIADDVTYIKELYYKTKLGDYDIKLEKRSNGKLVLSVFDGTERMTSYMTEGYRLYEGSPYTTTVYGHILLSERNDRLVALYNKLREPIRRKEQENAAVLEEERKKKKDKLKDFLDG